MQPAADSASLGSGRSPNGHPKPPFPAEAYLAAIGRERSARDYAFYDLPRTIGGIDILPMTLRTYMLRIEIGCPFLHDNIANAEDVCSFIWHLSAARHRTRLDVVAAYLARKAIMETIAAADYCDLVPAIRDFVEITFLDAPHGSGSGPNRAPVASTAAVLIDLFAHEYGWTEDYILDRPLVRLHQLLREITLRNNPKAILFNRWSDRVKADWANSLNSQLSTLNSQLKA